MEKLLEQQTFISEILCQLHETNDVTATINDVISKLCEYCQASSINIFESSEDQLFLDNTFGWCIKGITSTIDSFQNIPYNRFLNIRPLIRKEKLIKITRHDQLPEELKDLFPYYENAAILFISMDQKEIGRAHV